MPIQKVYSLNLPIKNTNMNPVAVLVKNDNGGNKFVMTLFHDGKPIDLTEASVVTFTVLKGDGTNSVGNCIIENAQEGRISYSLTDQCLAYVGICEVTIEVYSNAGTVRITSTKFVYEVRGELSDGTAIPSETEYPILTGLIEDCTEVLAAEALRVTSETGRVSAESTRESNETSRLSAESSRVLAENDRVQAETVRNASEGARDSAETLRASAETGRLSAETLRATAESSRATAETGRVDAELLRDSAEGIRATAETTRLTAETLRQTAETARNVFETYNELKAYKVGNKVSWQGSSYVAGIDNTGVLPSTYPTWLLIAKKGDPGADGSSFTILGLYATLLDLQTAHPVGEVGDAYAVGTVETNEIHIWDSVASQWQNIGPMQGPPGIEGKSAYQAAIDGGYVGTEAEFNILMSNPIEMVDELFVEEPLPRDADTLGGQLPEYYATSDDVDDFAGAIATHVDEKASQANLGHVKVDGETIEVDANGVIGVVGNLVAEVVVDTDKSAVDITGLDLNTDGIYELVINIKNTTQVAGAYALYFNGDYTVSNYILQHLSADGTSLVGGRQDGAGMAFCAADGTTSVKATIIKDARGYGKFLSEESRGLPTALSLINVTCSTKNVVANITSLRLVVAYTNNIGAGSVIKIYKK